MNIQSPLSPCSSLASSPGDNSRGPYCQNACIHCHKRKQKCERDGVNSRCRNCIEKNKNCEIRPKGKPGPKPKKPKNNSNYSQNEYHYQRNGGSGSPFSEMLSNTNDHLSSQHQHITRRASFHNLQVGWEQRNDNVNRGAEARRHSDVGVHFGTTDAVSSFPPYDPLATILMVSGSNPIIPINSPMIQYTPMIPGNTPMVPSLTLGNTPLIPSIVIDSGDENSPYSQDYIPPSPLSLSTDGEGNYTDGEGNYTDGEGSYTDGRENYTDEGINGLGMFLNIMDSGEHEHYS